MGQRIPSTGPAEGEAGWGGAEGGRKAASGGDAGWGERRTALPQHPPTAAACRRGAAGAGQAREGRAGRAAEPGATTAVTRAAAAHAEDRKGGAQRARRTEATAPPRPGHRLLGVGSGWLLTLAPLKAAAAASAGLPLSAGLLTGCCCRCCHGVGMPLNVEVKASRQRAAAEGADERRTRGNSRRLSWCKRRRRSSRRQLSKGRRSGCAWPRKRRHLHRRHLWHS